MAVLRRCGVVLVWRVWSRAVATTTAAPTSTSGLTVRTRFAPSPTGDIHLGGLRSMLYNYLFAKQNGGQFLLRIEDTDAKRKVSGSAESIESLVTRLGLNLDESPGLSGPCAPYTQSQRLPIYADIVQQLLDSGHAYRCYCNRNRLDLVRRAAVRDGNSRRYDGHCRRLSDQQLSEFQSRQLSSVVRFKLECEDDVCFDDMSHGRQSVEPARQEGDPILMKSDGYPTYHLASVVDDHLMGITHVLRGIEWLISTPKHLAIYRALGWQPPQFAHLPLICNSDGSKLSKRAAHGQTVARLLRVGYLPEALLHYVCLSGGGFPQLGCDQLHLLPQLVELFDVRQLTARVTHQHVHHLYRLNLLAMRRALANNTALPASASEDEPNQPLDGATNRHQIVNQLRHIVEDTDVDEDERGSAQRFRLSEKPVFDQTAATTALQFVLDTGRINCLSDLVGTDYAYLWSTPNVERLVEQYQHEPAMADILQLVITHIADSCPRQLLAGSSAAEQYKLQLITWLRQLCEHRHLSFGRLMYMLRVALSGVESGPGVTEIVAVLGGDESVRRLTHSLSQLRRFQQPPASSHTHTEDAVCA